MRSRTLVMEEPGSLAVREIDVPEIGAGELLVEIELSGVCGTDVHLNEGGMALEFPVVPGHEFSGTVVEAGEGVETDSAGHEVGEGDAVTVVPGRACGNCWYCVNVPTRPTACTERVVYGFRNVKEGPGLHGGMSEYVVVESDADVYRLPNGMDVELGALIEPLAVASHALERGYQPGLPNAREGFGLGQTVVVQGAGPIGLLTVAAATAAGADRVISIDLIEERLKLAEGFGATDAIDLREYDGEDDLIQAVKGTTPGGVGPDLVVEAVGQPSAFRQGLKMPRNGGTLVEVGHFADAGEVSINPTDIVQNDVSVVSSYVYPPTQFGTALSLLERNGDRFPFAELFNHRTGLDEAADAFEKQASGEAYRATIHP
jgi:2-desacetyl-2-hydroxyethyl bacteriochlorophyllide A dehydrogenase